MSESNISKAEPQKNHDPREWFWKMDWCKKQRRHPGEKENWDAAEQAYAEHKKSQCK